MKKIDLVKQLESAAGKVAGEAPLSPEEVHAMRTLGETLPEDLANESETQLAAALEAFKRRRRRQAFTMATAAALVLLLLGWSAFRFLERDPGGVQLALVIQDFRLSRYSPDDDRVRGPSDPGDAFQNGDEVFLHLDVAKDGVVFVAMLDSKNELVPLSAKARPANESTRFLGPFELDDNPGTESFVVLSTEENLDAEAFLKILREVSTALAADSKSHEALLGSVLSKLESHDGLTAKARTFEHRAKSK